VCEQCLHMCVCMCVYVCVNMHASVRARASVCVCTRVCNVLCLLCLRCLGIPSSLCPGNQLPPPCWCRKTGHERFSRWPVLRHQLPPPCWCRKIGHLQNRLCTQSSAWTYKVNLAANVLMSIFASHLHKKRSNEA